MPQVDLDRSKGLLPMMEHLVIVAVTILSVGCTNSVEQPQFKITTKRDNDKIEVKAESDKAIISIHSPFGISQAVIERTDKSGRKP